MIYLVLYRVVNIGPVQLASRVGQRLYTVLSCHLMLAGKESA